MITLDMKMGPLLLAVLLSLPIYGEWQRHVMTPKGERVDKPEPHPLAYFTEYPMLRNESGDFCYLCTPEKKLEEAKKFEVKTELSLVGNLAGFEIYDLYYRFEGPGATETKLILVKLPSGDYRSIYHCDPTQIDAQAVPSELVGVGTNQFLEARYIVGGRAADTYDYFWFGETEPVLVDFRTIFEAATSVLDAGKRVRWVEDQEQQKVPGTHYLWSSGQPLRSRIQVINEVDNSRAGVVDVEFKFDRGRVVPTSASFDPKATAGN